MKSVFFSVLGFALCLAGCQQPAGHKTNADTAAAKATAPPQCRNSIAECTVIRAGAENMYQIADSGELSSWGAYNSMTHISIKEDSVVYDYSPSCGIWFASKIIDSTTMRLYWKEAFACPYTVFPEQVATRFGTFPKGQLFADFILVDDTTIAVQYYRPQWIQAVNKYTWNEFGRTAFPYIFHFRQPETQQ